MNILTITENYPYQAEPYNGIFVKKTVDALRSLEHKITVIKPISMSRIIASWVNSMAIKPIESGESSVIHPVYFGLPLRYFGKHSWVVRFNESRQLNAIKNFRSIVPESQSDTVIYSHFYPSIRLASKSYPEYPIVSILGESSPWLYDKIYGLSWPDKLLSCAAVVAVSKTGYDYYLERCPDIKDRIHCVPNGVDISYFKPQDKSICRQKLGINSETKLAVFVGGFDERKGPLRVLEAVRKFGCKVAFLGRGGQVPEGVEVIVAKSVQHDELLYWLGAADCFILPSLSEGRSNAILEAMACGVPVVVSNLPFNAEFVTPACGALVDPLSTDSIAQGLEKVFDKTNAQIMRREARRIAEGLSYETRIHSLETIFRNAICSSGV
jgi:teichuronic acid biosynthesis glycosyltransferase TuaC